VPAGGCLSSGESVCRTRVLWLWHAQLLRRAPLHSYIQLSSVVCFCDTLLPLGLDWL